MYVVTNSYSENVIKIGNMWGVIRIELRHRLKSVVYVIVNSCFILLTAQIGPEKVLIQVYLLVVLDLGVLGFSQ